MKYLARRLLLFVVGLFAISVVIFLALRFCAQRRSQLRIGIREGKSGVIHGRDFLQ